ncbi:MAG: HAMP domain-containing histidine kinase [Prevotella sp.]|nr:HAMP domain-containing histidine kinase [Prevotella sp.]
MTYLLLYASQQSSTLTNLIIWVLLGAVIVLQVILIIWQQKQGRQLQGELAELDKIQKHNIEYEFVLKTMRLSTWHIKTDTREIVFDTDFRDKSGTYIPAMGKELVAAMPENDRQRVMKSLDDLSAGLIEEAHEEYQIFLPGSKTPYWSESYAAVAERDADGKPTRIVGTSARIDERKAMESALVEARNRAEESDRLKTAFLANMSHEIRTPLNAIIGFTSVLPDVADPAERQQLLDLIHENTQKLLRIIDDVVNISKIEAGKEEMVMTEFDLPQIITAMADEYRPKCRPGVELLTNYASDMQLVTTDLNRFTEVVKHLLSNATKFTDHGQVTIGFDAPQDGRIRIKVSDTGKGIAKEHLEQIFERFFKVDEFIPGAGLGLSICRVMAYSMGGSVTVQSQLGEGSTFTFEIPIA